VQARIASANAGAVRRKAGDLLAADLDQRFRLEPRRHLGGEAVAIDRKRAAGRKLVPVGRLEDQRAAAAHLLVQQSDRVLLGVVGAERIGADQLGAEMGLVRLSRPLRAHLVQHGRHARPRELPGRLAPREPAADHMHPFAHGRLPPPLRSGKR
jgi:hypothetical protein